MNNKGSGSRAKLSGLQMGLLLAMVTSVQALATFAVLVLPTLATKAAPDFGIGAESVGYQISLVYFAAASLSSIAGVFVRRWGGALISAVALMLGVVGLVAMSSGSVILGVLASLSIGCGYGLTNPAASHLLFRFAPRERQNLIFALKQTGVPMGGMLAALLLPSLSERLGWPWAMVTASMLLMVATLPLLGSRATLDDDRDPSARMTGGVLAGVKVVLAHPRLRAFAFMGLAYASYQFCLFTFLITMLAEDFGWPLVAAGQMVTAMQIGGAIGRIIWSVIADRTGRGLDVLILIGLGSAGFAMCLAAATSAWPVWLLGFVLVGFGFCLVGWNGLWLAEIARTCRPEDVSLATGGVLVFTFGGIVLGPAAFATAYKLIGSYALTYGAFSVLALAGVASLLAVRSKLSAPPSQT